jgi:hypothetical protein
MSSLGKNVLQNFDWDLRFCLSSDKVANLGTSVIRLSLPKEDSSSLLELDSQELQNFIARMEEVERTINGDVQANS